MAQSFTGDGDGILIEFDLIETSKYKLRGFHCEWISQFKEEAEVLFLGGRDKICIVGVTIMSEKPKPKTYQIYFRALAKFNEIINGRKQKEWTSSEIPMICDLIDWKSSNKHNPNIDQYIYDSFQLFSNNKSIISLDYDELNKSDPNIVKKIMYGIEDNHSKLIDLFSDSYLTNSCRFDVILSLFNNLKSINIYNAKYYKFSVSFLLSAISASSTITTISIYGVYKGWIYDLWNNNGDKLVSMFNQRQFDIDYYNEELLITRDIKHPYFHAINRFNDMINGKWSSDWTKSQRLVICNLINYKIDEQQSSNIDKSIIDSFQAFIYDKVEINLHHSGLNGSDSEIVSKLMHKMEENKYEDIDLYSDSYSTNLFRGDVIFKLFNNLQSIVIVCYWKFSMSYLLSMIINSHSLQTITVDCAYWIDELWNTDKDKLISMFNQHQFDIKYERQKLIISRQ